MGSLAETQRSIILNTQQFDDASQQRLIELLNQQWSVKAGLNRDKQYWRIRISVGSVPRFKEIVAPHILPQFQYKFPS